MSSITKATVFYAWQSDLPRQCGQDIIRRALKVAAELLSESTAGTLQVTVDEATRGEPGSPNIPLTIFKKIATSDIFVADVSTITSGYGRPVQNPNVLIELGHASALLGWQRIILLGNNAFGAFPEDLPFDIDRHRATTFGLNQSDAHNKDKAAAVVKHLGSTLKNAIDAIIQTDPSRPVVLATSTDEIKRTRDRKALSLILRYLNPDVIDAHILHAPKQVSFEVLQFWEGFRAVWNSTTIDIYDPQLRAAISELYAAWETSLSFGEHYHLPRNSSFSIWTNSLGNRDDWTVASEAIQRLSVAKDEVFRLIREMFVEIDLDEQRRDSWMRFHAEDARLARFFEAQND